MTLKFVRCTGLPTCATDAEYLAWSGNLQMQIVVMSAYFDPDNYTQPIKYFFDDANFPLLSGATAVT